MSDEPGAAPRVTFLVTKEYRRFAEFCEACRRDRYIGLCAGPPGVGKTLSARHYAHWDQVEPLLPPHPLRQPLPLPVEIAAYHTAVYTPTVVGSPTRLAAELAALEARFARVVEDARPAEDARPWWPETACVELVIVDEADRLRPATLEHVRDVYDRTNQRSRLGLVLIGLPGIEKWLARYPQLYSRVGFVHHYRPLSEAELHFILTHKWAELGLTLSPAEFTDVEAAAAIARITGGNFRLLQRLFSQIARVLEINELRLITKEVVEAARESLVIGPLP
jgi:DNA transposition AAA+ family ATPase